MGSMTGVWGPALVFLALAIWLLRKVVKAAHTESVLEENRLAAALGEEAERLRARAAAAGASGPAAGDAAVARPRLAAVPGAGVTSASESAPNRPSEFRVTHSRGATAALASEPEVTAGLPASRGSLARADTAGCAPGHLALLAALLDEGAKENPGVRVDVLWAKSSATQLAWCERRTPAAAASASGERGVTELICVADVRDGKLVRRAM